jgi:hypothetical protein
MMKLQQIKSTKNQIPTEHHLNLHLFLKLDNMYHVSIFFHTLNTFHSQPKKLVLKNVLQILLNLLKNLLLMIISTELILDKKLMKIISAFTIMVKKCVCENWEMFTVVN